LIRLEDMQSLLFFFIVNAVVVVQSADPSEHGDQLSRNRDQRERHQAGVGRIPAFATRIRQHLLVGCTDSCASCFDELFHLLDTLNWFS
jgi:hypothetical protein